MKLSNEQKLNFTKKMVWKMYAGSVMLEVCGSSFRTFWSGIQTMCPVAGLHQHATGRSTSFTEDLSLLNQLK